MSERLDRVVSGQKTKDFECAICADLIKDARQLQKYMYCNDCINDVVKHARETEGHGDPKCPACRQVFTEASIIQERLSKI